MSGRAGNQLWAKRRLMDTSRASYFLIGLGVGNGAFAPVVDIVEQVSSPGLQYR